jgi:hypothetical protein
VAAQQHEESGLMFEIMVAVKFVLAWIGWLGIGLIPALACAAVVWFFPPLRKFAIAAGVLWAVAFLAYTYGDNNGADRVQDDWKAAEQRAIERGSDARSEAESAIPPLVEEPRPEPVVPGVVAPVPRSKPAAPRRLSNDRYERDNP